MAPKLPLVCFMYKVGHFTDFEMNNLWKIGIFNVIVSHFLCRYNLGACQILPEYRYSDPERKQRSAVDPRDSTKRGLLA